MFVLGCNFVVKQSGHKAVAVSAGSSLLLLSSLHTSIVPSLQSSMDTNNYELYKHMLSVVAEDIFIS